MRRGGLEDGLGGKEGGGRVEPGRAVNFTPFHCQHKIGD